MDETRLEGVCPILQIMMTTTAHQQPVACNERGRLSEVICFGGVSTDTQGLHDSTRHNPSGNAALLRRCIVTDQRWVTYVSPVCDAKRCCTIVADLTNILLRAKYL